MPRTMLCLILLGLTACATTPPEPPPTVVNNLPGNPPLETVAQFSDRLVTGVTVSQDNRVFVCFPLWYPHWYQGAVAEVLPDGSVRPYPDEAWNAWRLDNRLDPSQHFVCVQSVVADKDGSLWVLDPAAPWEAGLIEEGPKLVQIDLATDRVQRVYPFGPDIAPPGSYLNDVRIDNERDWAYITDSGKGALIAVNLQTGQAHRMLEDHPATQAEEVTPIVGGQPLTGPDGNPPKIHSDGIALDADGRWLYFHPLTGYHTFRIPTQALRELHDQPQQLAAAVEDLGSDVITDGMHLDAQGSLYYTALEYDAILKRDAAGNVVPVLIDPRLRWPDTLAIGPDGSLYVTASQIHRTPRFTGQTNIAAPWSVYRVDAGLRPPAR